MRTSIATVCVSGTLTEKLHACAAAGFDGVELFEPDLIAAPESPEEIRALADRLGLRLDLYQPLRDVEGVTEAEFIDVLRRAEAKFALMRRLGMDLVLCCSNVATATIDDDDVSADQLRRLGALAAEHGIRIAYEALAWGRFVDDYRRAWRIVQLADHPAVGICLDSFHVLSRGHDPAAIAQIPGEKIFFLQLADAPDLSLDVLSWSRHHRLFPGEGVFDLVAFVRHVQDAGYTGPWSLEVFNDTFRQIDVRRTAVHAHRSLRWLEDRLARAEGYPVSADLRLLPDAATPVGIDFVEIAAADVSAVEELLAQLGFCFRGRHRTKPVALWTAGSARIVVGERSSRATRSAVAAVGFEVDDADAVTRRVDELGIPRAFRRTYRSEQELSAAIAPDGTEIFWGQAADVGESRWVAEFERGEPPVPNGIHGVDHLSLTLPWQVVDETVLFFASAFALQPAGATEVAGPRGLVQSRVLGSPDGGIRIPLNVAPAVLAERGADSGLPQHIAFACDDVEVLAAAACARGLEILPIPDNYYEDVAARTGLDAERIARLRTFGILYDRAGDAEYLNFYTRTVDDVFFEFVQRRHGYSGFAAGNAPVRLAAQAAL